MGDRVAAREVARGSGGQGGADALGRVAGRDHDERGADPRLAQGPGERVDAQPGHPVVADDDVGRCAGDGGQRVGERRGDPDAGAVVELGQPRQPAADELVGVADEHPRRGRRLGLDQRGRHQVAHLPQAVDDRVMRPARRPPTARPRR